VHGTPPERILYDKNIATMSQFDQIINSETPVLVDFYAVWCGPCKMVAPVLEDYKRKMGDKVRIVKIDVDKNPQLASRYQVSGVPTLALFKKGKMLWRKSGALPLHVLQKELSAYVA
jgi:thioredoxin 1